MPFRRPKRWILAENDDPLLESYLLTHFQSKSCTNLSKTEFWHTKKTSTETKIFKKYNFRDRNDRIWLKNDDSPGESFPLTYFQSKSFANLPQTEFWHKKQRRPKQKFSKKCRFRGRNDGILPKKDEPLPESYLLTHFQTKSCTNLSKTEFWHKKKRALKRKFRKNAVS